MFVKVSESRQHYYAFLVESYRSADRPYPLQRIVGNFGRLSLEEARRLRRQVRHFRKLRYVEEVLADYGEEAGGGLRHGFCLYGKRFGKRR